MDDNPSGGNAAPPPSPVSSAVAVAETALAEAERSLGETRGALDEAKRTLLALEVRVREGDEGATYEQLARAEHLVQVRSFAVEREQGRASAARQAVHRAQAAALAEGWSERAPALRAAIREAVEHLLAADQALFAAVKAYDRERERHALAIRQLRVPVVSAEPLTVISYQMLRKLLPGSDRAELSVAASLLPPDIVPFDLLEQIHGKNFKPRRP